MTRRPHSSHLPALLLAALLSLGAGGPGPAVEALENEVASIQAELQGAQQARRTHDQRADALAAQIEAAKREGARADDPQLLGNLRESRRIGAALQAADARIAELSASLRGKLEATLRAYGSRIDELQRQAEGQKGDARDALVASIRELARARDALRKRLQSASGRQLPRRASGRELDVDPLDGPEELREKEAILRDEQDKLERTMERLKAELEEERQMQELDAFRSDQQLESSLFDEEDRLYTFGGSGSGGAEAADVNNSNGGNRGNGANEAPQSPDVGQSPGGGRDNVGDGATGDDLDPAAGPEPAPPETDGDFGAGPDVGGGLSGGGEAPPGDVIGAPADPPEFNAGEGGDVGGLDPSLAGLEPRELGRPNSEGQGWEEGAGGDRVQRLEDRLDRLRRRAASLERKADQIAREAQRLEAGE